MFLRRRRRRSSAAPRWPAARARCSGPSSARIVLTVLQNGFNLIGISANPFDLILGIAILSR